MKFQLQSEYSASAPAAANPAAPAPSTIALRV